MYRSVMPGPPKAHLVTRSVGQRQLLVDAAIGPIAPDGASSPQRHPHASLGVHHQTIRTTRLAAEIDEWPAIADTLHLGIDVEHVDSARPCVHVVHETAVRDSNQSRWTSSPARGSSRRGHRARVDRGRPVVARGEGSSSLPRSFLTARRTRRSSADRSARALPPPQRAPATRRIDAIEPLPGSGNPVASHGRRHGTNRESDLDDAMRRRHRVKHVHVAAHDVDEEQTPRSASHTGPSPSSAAASRTSSIISGIFRWDLGSVVDRRGLRARAWGNARGSSGGNGTTMPSRAKRACRRLMNSCRIRN